MIFHYAGRYNGNESSLPVRKHHPGAAVFREPENAGKLSLIVNSGAAVLVILLSIPFVLLGRKYIHDNALWMAVGSVLAVLSLLPHELLHAVCFKRDVYLYQDLSHGLLFVTGTEDMTKKQFVFMCLCPNIFLGFIPYVIFLLFPSLVGFGIFGIICTAMGFGDYLNVYNALTQMPKNAVTYQSGMHSYWYLDKEDRQEDPE